MSDIVITEAKSFRCPYCEKTWPPVEEFAVCPCCREETVGSTMFPMDDELARQHAIHFAFGWYLFERGLL